VSALGSMPRAAGSPGSVFHFPSEILRSWWRFSAPRATSPVDENPAPSPGWRGSSLARPRSSAERLISTRPQHQIPRFSRPDSLTARGVHPTVLSPRFISVRPLRLSNHRHERHTIMSAPRQCEGHSPVEIDGTTKAVTSHSRVRRKRPPTEAARSRSVSTCRA
jgi:hypothetical protein